MSILASLQRTFGPMAGSVNGSAYPYRREVDYRIDPDELPPAAMYALLRQFSLNNGLYEVLARSNVVLGRHTAQVKALRNPAPAVLDFWGSKTWPEPLTIVTENAAIVEPIEQVWRWSNWRARRRTVARWAARDGEYYLKVQADPAVGRVWFEALEATYITSFEEDPRGYITSIRVDIPKVDDEADTRRRWTHTETWSSDEQLYRRWETDGDASQKRTRDLGPPIEELPLSTFGIDFVPFVRVPFSDIGEARGVGAIQLAIEAIVDADISATNLHAMLYQDADGAWVLKSVGTDANGRPLAPPVVGSRTTDNGTGRESDGSITVGKRSFWRLPGNQELQSVVADINYEAALAILQDHDAHLEQLMPALSYSRISELSGGDLSGRAIRFKLSSVVDQVTDVRALALEKLAQADMMALTLGQVNGIPGFDALGTFDGGGFEHTFEDQGVIPISDLEESEGEMAAGQAAQAWQAAGLPMAEILRRTGGYTEEEITNILNMAADEVEASMERQAEMFGGQDQQQQQEDEQNA